VVFIEELCILVSFVLVVSDVDGALFADLSKQDWLLSCGTACCWAVETWRSSWWLCLAHQQSATSKTHTYHSSV